MEDKDPFFAFIRETAGSALVNPDPEIRKQHIGRLEREALRLRNRRRFYRYPLLTGLALISLAGIYWILAFEPSGKTGQNPDPKDQEAIGQTQIPHSQNSDPSLDEAANEFQTQTQPQTQEPAATDNSPKSKVIHQLISNSEETDTKETLPTERIQPVNLLTSIKYRILQSTGIQSINKRSSSLSLSFGKTDTLLSSQNQRIKSWVNGFSAGIHYTPEYIFNTLDQTDQWIHNAGVEILWSKHALSIRSGISLSSASGVTGLQYTYNEFLGMTQKLDSVGFTYDPVAREVVPDWYFSEHSVFDTAINQESRYIRKRYTYLQIPMILGYDFLETRSFTLGLRAGPVLQVLMSTSQLDSDSIPGSNKILNINQLTPDRLNTHWQVLAGFNTGIRLSRKSRIELEPHIKYSFNSV